MAAGQLIIPYSWPALTSTGQPAAGATAAIYNTGSPTLANIYADVGLSTLITNPIVANSAGRFTQQSTVVWASDAQAYDIVLTFPDGSNLTFDNIFVLEGQSSTSGFAPINSPNFTGVPTAPTPATNDNSNKIATTAYVQNQNYAPLASPAFSGGPTAPTPTGTDNSTRLATTAFVQALISGTGGTLSPTVANLLFSNGGILKAGQSLQTITSPTTKSITFPTQFPNACIIALPVIYNPSVTSSTVTSASVVSFSASGATFLFNGYQSGSYNSIPGFYWIALGF